MTRVTAKVVVERPVHFVDHGAGPRLIGEDLPRAPRRIGGLPPQIQAELV